MTTPPEPQNPPASDSGLDTRVSKLETGQTSMESKLDKLLGFFSGDDPHDAPAPETAPPADIAGEIRRQLDERDRAAAKDKPADPPKPPDPKELAEKQPVPMARRVERLMGWAQ